MPLPTIPDVVRVAVKGVTPAGSPFVNVLHYKDDTAVSLDAAIALFHAQLTTLYSTAGFGVGKNGWGALGATSARTVEVAYTPLFDDLATRVLAMAQTGGATGDALPSDTALCITLRTNLRGPRYRGRQYWAGGTEANNTATGKVLAATLGQLVAGWGQFLINLSGANVPLVVASYKFSEATLVTSVSANDTWDRQRRRAL